MKAVQDYRTALQDAKRIVIKIGTRVLVQSNGRPHHARIQALVKDIAGLQKSGREVILVTSGAVGAGMEALDLKTRPTNLPDLQMAAAVGQTRLMTAYDQYFGKQRCRIGQILLTHDDLKNRARHLNARNTLMNLLRHECIPVVNENDVVSVDEIQLGDNDVLAALVTILVDAELLVLLTTVNGLREPARGGRTKRVKFLDRITPEVKKLIQKKGSHMSTGGMGTKLGAAEKVCRVGGMAVIADGTSPGILQRIVAGEDVGTLVGGAPGPAAIMTGKRKHWLAFFHKPQGVLVLDDGACRAVLAHGKSLLPIGIKSVAGNFTKGAVVEIMDAAGQLIAHGLTGYGSDEIQAIQGKKSSEIMAILGRKDYDEVIHRDNLAILVGEK